MVDARSGVSEEDEVEPRTATADDGSDQPKITGRQVALFAVVAVALLMSTLDMTIVATALESLQRGLDTSVAWAGWTITAYSLGMVLMLPLSGKLTDRLGSRKVFLVSIIVFTAASLLCGLATGIHELIVLRFVQALGGAGFTPSATRIVVEHFGPARDKAVGLFGTLFTSGAMIGPLLGGVIVSGWSWRGVFLVNVPLGIVLAPLSLRFIPADAPVRPRADRVRSGFDLAGVAYAAIGLASAMVAASLLGESPSEWIVAIAVCAALAVGGLWAFGRHVRRVDDPLIAPRLIGGRGFAAVNVINVLYAGGAIGLMALVPLYATTRYGIDAFGSGTLLAAEGVAAVTLSTLGALALRRTGYRLPLYVTAVFVVLGMVALALPPQGMSAYAWLACSAALVGIGLGIASPASRNAGLQLLPDQAAPIAAVRTIGLQLGSIMTVSAATAVIEAASNPSIAQAWVFVAFAALTVCIGVPTVRRIPEHRGSW